MSRRKGSSDQKGENRASLSGDDLAIWKSIAETTKPLPGRAVRVPSSQKPSDKSVHDPRRSAVVPPETKNHDAIRNQGSQALQAGKAPGVDGRTADRLRRGQLPIEARVDLHGMTQTDAHRALGAFISGNYHADRRVLLVITGKGKTVDDPDEHSGSRVTGVIRRTLPDWLNSPELRPMVLAFTRAQARDGGDGAFYVLLKRKR